MKHLLKLLDLSKEEITELLDLADRLKAETKAGVEHHILKGKTLGMIFEKSSTRTRVSFETGMYQLGGHALFLSSRDLQIGRGEPVEDTARVLSRYLDGIMIRTFAQEEVETLARVGSIPIINGLTDFCHPCQVLADLQTVREYKGRIEGLNMCYIGDGNNGQFADCRLPQNGRACVHRLPEGISAGRAGALVHRAVPRQVLHDRKPGRSGEGCGRHFH